MKRHIIQSFDILQFTISWHHPQGKIPPGAEAGYWMRIVAFICFAIQLSLGPLNAGDIGPLRAAAQTGDASAQYALGEILMGGHGVSKAPEEAEKWFLAAAKQDNPAAQYSLFLFYNRDLRDREDLLKATKWLRKSATLGHVEAQYQLAERYILGPAVTGGIARNPEEYVKWMLMAANQGYAEAQFALFYDYLQGEFVEQDIDRAIKWLKVAAASDHPEAMSYLARFCMEGTIVEEDKAKAEQLLRKLANNENFGGVAKQMLSRLEGTGSIRPMKPAAKAAFPPVRISSYWKHNGSTMGLISDENVRTFVYVHPRSGLDGLVESGDVLFKGVSKGGKYIGFAYRFSKGLPPLKYEVAGPILDDGARVVLRGKAPVRNSDGSVRATIIDELVFTYLSKTLKVP